MTACGGGGCGAGIVPALALLLANLVGARLRRAPRRL